MSLIRALDPLYKKKKTVFAETEAIDNKKQGKNEYDLYGSVVLQREKDKG